MGTTEDPASVTSGGSTTLYDHNQAGVFAEKTGSVVRYDLSDLHGDVVALTSSPPAFDGTAKFDPWGPSQSSPGTQGVLGFQGDPTDQDTGWVDMGARVYLPGLGRFTTADPVFGDPTRRR